MHEHFIRAQDNKCLTPLQELPDPSAHHVNTNILDSVGHLHSSYFLLLCGLSKANTVPSQHNTIVNHEAASPRRQCAKQRYDNTDHYRPFEAGSSFLPQAKSLSLTLISNGLQIYVS